MIEASAKNSAPRPNLGQLVAVVDDDYRVLESLGDLLQVRGYRMLLSPSAEDFLQMPWRSEVDFLISDIALPGMSGLDLLRTLRRDSQVPPAIFITGRSEKHFERDARDLGAPRLFMKPFDTGELLATLRASLGRAPLAAERP